jgi:hypothetical protein
MFSIVGAVGTPSWVKARQLFFRMMEVLAEAFKEHV